MKSFSYLLISTSICAGMLACGDDGPEVDNEEEVISTLTLDFTGASSFTVAAKDDDGDGVIDSVDPITLAAGATYTVAAGFLNELETPAEDIGEEVAEEAEEHQIFFTVMPAATLDVAYADQESDYTMNTVGDDLPVGLSSTWTTTTAGSGTVRVQLRHLPAIDEMPQKVANTAATAGDVDFEATFDVTVQ